MSYSTISVDEEALEELRRAMGTAGENYKMNLNRLNNLINEITSGDIQGEPANDLLNKYTEKKEIFEGLARTIEEAEEYMGMKKAGFNDMMGNLSSGMR